MPDTDRPAGLVPGQIVTLRALVRATSQGECYVEVMTRASGRRLHHQFWLEQGDAVATGETIPLAPDYGIVHFRALPQAVASDQDQ